MKKLAIILISLSAMLWTAPQTQADQAIELIDSLHDYGHYAEALDQATRLIETDPSRVDAIRYEVWAGLSLRDPKQYIQSVFSGDDSNYPEAMRRFFLLMQTGRHIEAAETLDKIEKTFEPNGWIDFCKATMAYAQIKDSLALSYYQAAAEDPMIRSTALQKMAWLHYRWSELDPADSLFKLLIDDPLYGSTAKVRLAEIVGLKGDWNGAFARMEKFRASGVDPALVLGWTRVLNDLGRYHESLAELEKAVERWPKVLALRSSLAWAADRGLDWSKSLKSIENFTPSQLADANCGTPVSHAFTINDTLLIEQSVQSHIAYGYGYSYPYRRYTQWLQERGRYAEVDSLLARITSVCGPYFVSVVKTGLVEDDDPISALSIQDSILSGWHRFGSIMLNKFDWLIRSGQTDKAYEIADWIISRQPGDVQVMGAFARSEYWAANSKGAKGWLDRIDNLVSGNSKVISLRMRLARDDGDQQLALKYLDSLTTIYPHRLDLLWYYRDLYDWDTDTLQLAEVAQRFSQTASDHPEHACNLAMTFSAISQFEIADSLLAVSLAKYPGSAELYYYRGLVTRRSGNYKLAEEYFSTAKAKDPFEDSYFRALYGTTFESLSLDDFVQPSAPDTTGLVRLSIDSILSLAKNAKPKPGSVDPDGIVLLQKNQLIIYSEYRRLRREHEILQIVSTGGTDRYDGASYYFNSWRETPRLITARVIHPDGTTDDLAPHNAYVMAQSGSFSDGRRLSWHYSTLKVGDIVESIVQFDQGHADAQDLYRRFLMNSGLPIIQTTYELWAPGSWPIHFEASDQVTSASRDSSGLRIYTWSCHDLPAQEWEANGPNLYETGPTLHYGYKKTWAEEAEKYERRVRAIGTPNEEIKQLAHDLTSGLETEAEKISALFGYASQAIRYVAIEFGDGSIIPRPPTEVISNQYGDCKDKSVLLASLLEVVGIEGDLALISNNDSSVMSMAIPDIDQFNHMIVYLPAQQQFLDPTCSDCDPTRLTYAYSNKSTLIIGSGLADPLLRTPLVGNEANEYTRSVRMTAREKGGLDLQISLELTGDVATYLKAGYREEDTASVRSVVQRYSGIGLSSKAKFESFEFDDPDWNHGPRIAWTASMTIDSSFVPEKQFAALVLWFYSPQFFMDHPDTTDRTMDYIFSKPFRVKDQFILIQGEKWEQDSYNSGWTMNNEFFSASCTFEDYADSISITLQLEPNQRRIKFAEVEAFAKQLEIMDERVTGQAVSYRAALDLERIATLETALANNPSDQSLMMGLVQSYLGEDEGGNRCEAIARRERAADILTTAWELNPSQEYLAIQLATLLMRDQKFASADSVITAYGKEYDLSALSQLLLFYTSSALGRNEIAQTMLEAAMSQIPGDDMRVQLTDILCKQEKWDEAKKQIDLLEALNADPTLLARARLTYFLELDSLDKAAEIVENWPDTSGNLRLQIRASLHERSRDYQSALADAMTVLDETPDNAGVLNNAAWYMAHLDSNLTTALELINRTLALTGPCNLGSLNSRGFVLMKLGRLNEAEADFQAATAAQDVHSQTINYYFLGQCALLRDQEREAKDFFDLAIKYNGDDHYVELAETALASLKTKSN